MTPPSPCSTVMRAGTCCVSSPSGPFTITRPGEIDTDTPAGSTRRWLPTLLIAHPANGAHPRPPAGPHPLAADALLLGAAGGDQAVGRGQDCSAHTTEHTRQPVFSSV